MGQRKRAAWWVLIGALLLAASSVLAPPAVRAAAPVPAQTAPALLARIKVTGRAAARITVGTQVQVTGYAINTDTKQHDAFLAATLLDAGGHGVGRAHGKAEDMKPGKRIRFILTGAVTSPRWARVRVTVIRVTENVGGAGVD